MNSSVPRVSNQISTWRALLGMFLVSLAVQAFRLFNGPQKAAESVIGSNLVEMIGAAIGLMLIPALIIAVWRGIQSRRRQTNSPILVGGIVYLLLVLSVWITPYQL